MAKTKKRTMFLPGLNVMERRKRANKSGATQLATAIKGYATFDLEVILIGCQNLIGVGGVEELRRLSETEFLKKKYFSKF